MDLVCRLVETILVPLPTGGKLYLEIESMDFGMPNPAESGSEGEPAASEPPAAAPMSPPSLPELVTPGPTWSPSSSSNSSGASPPTGSPQHGSLSPISPSAAAAMGKALEFPPSLSPPSPTKGVVRPEAPWAAAASKGPSTAAAPKPVEFKSLADTHSPPSGGSQVCGMGRFVGTSLLIKEGGCQQHT